MGQIERVGAAVEKEEVEGFLFFTVVFVVVLIGGRYVFVCGTRSFSPRSLKGVWDKAQHLLSSPLFIRPRDRCLCLPMNPFRRGVISSAVIVLTRILHSSRNKATRSRRPTVAAFEGPWTRLSTIPKIPPLIDRRGSSRKFNRQVTYVVWEEAGIRRQRRRVIIRVGRRGHVLALVE